MTIGWGRFVIFVLWCLPLSAQAFLELGLQGGYRNLSSQGQNGVRVFSGQTGARAALFNTKLVSPEVAYGQMQASISGIKIIEHAIYAGVKITPKGKGRGKGINLGPLIGISYFQTNYQGPVPQKSHSTSGFYIGLGAWKYFGLFFARLDVHQTIGWTFDDSSTAMSTSIGISL